MKVQHFFDKNTFTLTYVVWDEHTKDAVIIDPVLDYDPNSSTVTKHSINQVIEFIKEQNLNALYSIETHAHADHLSGAHEIKSLLPQIKIGIGQNITAVQSTFKSIYNLKDFNTNGVQFDVLLNEDEPLIAGSLTIKTIFTPGHTPACSTYLIEDSAFTGDALFMPDFGTGRCYFPAGSAKDLYHSVHNKLYNLPDSTRTFTGHDYQPGGRPLEFESTIGEHKKNNIHLKETTTEQEYIEFRTTRDATLNTPKLLLPSIQTNIRAGELPKPEDNGTRYLKIPISEK